MANRKKVDPDSEAALAVVEMEKKKEELAKTERERRERAIAQCHEVIGRIQGLKMVSKFADVSNLVWLRDVKEQKIYRDLPGIGTWEQFCEYLGISRQKVDEDLINLRAFGEDFLTTVSTFRVGYRELRKLRQLTAGGDVTIDAGFVVLGEERIPLDQDHTEDLQAAIESLLEAKNQQIEELNGKIRGNNRTLKMKQELINKQEREIAKFEGKAKAKGYAPEEEAFLNMCSTHRAIIDELFLKIDAENFMPSDPTPRMKAAYVELAGYVLRIAQGLYDTGTSAYDILPDPDGWTPPGSEEEDASDGREELAECSKCKWHKGMGNKAHGVKIPGGYGKCTRPEGHCNPANPSKGI